MVPPSLPRVFFIFRGWCAREDAVVRHGGGVRRQVPLPELQRCVERWREDGAGLKYGREEVLGVVHVGFQWCP